MQPPLLQAGMPVPMAPNQGLLPHMASHVPILPRMPSGHAGLAGLARNASFQAEEMARAKKNGREEERGVNDGADVLLRAAKKARSELQPPVRSQETPFHMAIPARAPRGAFEAEEVARESGYIGVRWSRKKGKWRVRIKANGKDNHVGFFPDAVAAAMHYDSAAKRFFPQWKTDPSIRLNFPGESGQARTAAPALSPASALPKPDPEASSSSASATGINAILAASDASTSASTPSSAPPSSRSIGVSTAPNSGGKSVAVSEVPTVLKPLHIPAEHAKGKEKSMLDKSSLEHLLDDKTALVRTPSPQDASATPLTGLGGTASSISTPATLPSPSTLWSPSVSRCSTRGPYTETPPTIAGPPRLSAVACNTAGFVAPAPAVCVPGQHAAVKKEGEREESMNELEALRGLVELARENAPAVDFAIAHQKKASARPRAAEAAELAAAAGKKRDAASKKARERGRAVRAALSEAANVEAGEVDPASAPAGDGGRDGEGKRARIVAAVPTMSRRGGAPMRAEGYDRAEALHKKSQNFRGVTWDKVKQMWRVRLCLAGGGREHIGYFSDEHEGAMAYARALQRLKNELPAPREAGGPVAGAPGFAEESAQRGAFSQVGAEGQREVSRPGMQPAEASAGAAQIGAGASRGGSSGFQSVGGGGSTA